MKLATQFEVFFNTRGEFKDLDLTLDRMADAALEAGVNDDIATHTIHIAGTNGKGSTALFIEQILEHRGYKTACFTSPHISCITERIRLSATDIDISTFDEYFTQLKPIIERHKLSYFEGLTLIAFKYFQNNKPDFAIIETGLGGRFDSTNILNNKLPVITSISKDHEEYLGNDILKIADEKIAIIKNNLLVFIGDNTEYMNKYLNYKLDHKTITRANYDDAPYNGLDAPFSNNLKLAEAVCNFFGYGDIPNDISLPACRNEKIGRFTLDGAHNEDALQILAKRYAKTKPVVVFSSTIDRDTDKLLDIIKTFASSVVITSIPENNRSIDIDTVSQDIIKEKDPEKAIKIAVELSENADILVCGSLYLCAFVREILAKGTL
ncbi:MAG: hypothetical protein C0603_11985 [Denitrovibrio sp.]|nr:MAG: hypothetical protein C0603_11985 [Denitrovibrio sp.]